MKRKDWSIIVSRAEELATSGQFLFLYEIAYRLQSEGLGSARRLFSARPDLRDHLRETMAKRGLGFDNKKMSDARGKRSTKAVVKGGARPALDRRGRKEQEGPRGTLRFGKPMLSRDGTSVLFEGRDGSNRLICRVSKEALYSAYELKDNPFSFISAFREHYLDIQRRAAAKYNRWLGERPRVLELTAKDLVAKDRKKGPPE
jgi:hypothetical protein